MAAVFHLSPSYHGSHGKGRRAAAERLPALLRDKVGSPSAATCRSLQGCPDAAPSWPVLESRVRRLLWLAITLVVVGDLLGTFVLQVR